MAKFNIESLNKEILPQVEASLWETYNGDPSDMNRLALIELYLPLVYKVAKKISIKLLGKVPPEEFLSSGVIGLHDAIIKFDSEKKVLFTTFAYKRVYGAMMDEMRKRDHLTRNQRDKYKKIYSTINKLTETNSRIPSNEEVAEELSISIRELEKYKSIGNSMINLNQDFQEGMSYMDIISDEKSKSPLDEAHTSLAIEKMRGLFRSLTEREQKILFLRHYEEMSVGEIAAVFEVSIGRISQIYQKILEKMRKMMEK
jgi:RNA polymerase sigma factor for flagellar operon FliA